jgi:hypothetical protein
MPKGGRSRRLPMTLRLTSALKASRHLRSERVTVFGMVSRRHGIESSRPSVRRNVSQDCRSGACTCCDTPSVHIWPRYGGHPSPETFAKDGLPAEARAVFRRAKVGAGYGDRTRVRGLGSLCTTIVLSPHRRSNARLNPSRYQSRRSAHAVALRMPKYITRESARAPRRACSPSSRSSSPRD